MSLLRSIFGPSKAEIWTQIADEIGGEHIKPGFFKKGGLVYEHEEWTLVLDTYTVNNNNSSQTYTRMRAPFINKDGLYFKIYREGLFSSMGRFFGMQDLEIGDPYFDKNFVIKGNNQEQIRRLLMDENLKALIETQPRISLEIRDDDGWFGSKYPAGVDQLYFVCSGVMRDKRLLHDLFDLYCCVLERLVRIDSAYEDDPRVYLL
ncbi:MAG: DUF3137 domain-containing protein [Planctomycetaceae bacterium]|nr:DUF3137 domain-containing protein [Planctomycetaceae bacterium]